MLAHIIGDYGPAGDLAFAEVVQRIKLYLPNAEAVLVPRRLLTLDGQNSFLKSLPSFITSISALSGR